MKLVIDTNVLISGSLWQGPSARLISAALAGHAQIYLSITLLMEFREALQRPQFAQRLAAQGETPETIVDATAPHAMKPCRLLFHHLRICATPTTSMFLPAQLLQVLTRLSPVTRTC